MERKVRIESPQPRVAGVVDLHCTGRDSDTTSECICYHYKFVKANPLLVFVDESGDCGMKCGEGSSPYFIVTAVIFEDNEDAQVCDAKIAECRKFLKVRESFEFKFYSCNDRYRECFLKSVRGCNFFYYSIVLNKPKLYGPGFKDKNSFYKYATNLVFQNAKPHLRDATIVLDKCGNREFRTQLSRYLKRKMNSDGLELIKKIRMETSHSKGECMDPDANILFEEIRKVLNKLNDLERKINEIDQKVSQIKSRQKY